jgi:asparagine synthase (glutamine-hydrolysing)
MAQVVTAGDLNALYDRLISNFDPALPIVLGVAPPRDVGIAAFADVADFSRRAALFDLTHYLPDDLLAKLDRTSMAVSLEARVPLLDHRLVEFAMTLPPHFHHRNGQSKWLLRRLLQRHLPAELVERPKMGFSVPIGRWLRGPLKPWADSRLSEQRLVADGHLEPGAVRTMWKRHLGGSNDHQHALWAVLMFQSWLDEHALSRVA